MPSGGPKELNIYSTVWNKRKGANKCRGVQNEVKLINVGVRISEGGMTKVWQINRPRGVKTVEIINKHCVKSSTL